MHNIFVLSKFQQERTTKEIKRHDVTRSNDIGMIARVWDSFLSDSTVYISGCRDMCKIRSGVAFSVRVLRLFFLFFCCVRRAQASYRMRNTPLNIFACFERPAREASSQVISSRFCFSRAYLPSYQYACGAGRIVQCCLTWRGCTTSLLIYWLFRLSMENSARNVAYCFRYLSNNSKY